MDTELHAIINNAIAQEELSHEFYLRMANLVSHAETKETFQYLAQEELDHQAFLQSCLTAEGCKLMGHPQNVHLAEHLKAPEFTADLSPKEALVIAMKREEGSYRFYQGLAALQPPGEIRDFLEKMAQMELSHKEKVEYL
ncbi:MAG: ferritin family protein, partial [Deltaproteobacteria bacterium]|nr:ferritin family protein [Deltaproteobacteria bacterium]